MNEKGFTLVEVILAIAIIGMISVAFLPLITFSYTNLIGTEEFTQNMFDDQQLVENEIDSLRFIEPPNPGTNYETVFGVDVPVHHINISTSSSGQVKVYLPQQTMTPRVPILANSPDMKVRHNSNNLYVNPQPDNFHIFDDHFNLFTAEVPITDSTKVDFLMSVYRWYSTDEVSEMEEVSESTNDYIVIKEWNEAKTPISYSEAISTGFTPNIKEYTDPDTGLKEQYNVLNYSTLKKAYSYSNEEMINVFGNRYVRYGVTPYSIAGRIGEEVLSNPIYIEAPRLEILSAHFSETENSVVITFNMEIEDSFNLSSLILNEVLGGLSAIERDHDDHHKLLLEFSDPLNKSVNVTGNTLLRGAVVSKEFGAITIWSGDYPNADFIISP